MAAFEQAFEPSSLSLIAVSAACLLNEQSTTALLEKERPSVVVYADRPNIDGLSRLTRQLSHYKVPLIMLSSHLVFGDQQGHHFEADTPVPTCTEGQHWLAAEGIALALAQAIIIRLPWTLTRVTQGAFDEAALDRLCRAITTHSAIDVSEVASGSLITWNDAARVVAAIVQQLLCGADNWGIFHLHSSDVCSEAELADALARLLKAEGLTVAELVATKQSSPHWLSRNAALVGRRCTDNFGIQLKSFRVGLKGQVKAWIQRELPVSTS